LKIVAYIWLIFFQTIVPKNCHSTFINPHT
jgi:hypothetical protein